MQLLLLVGVLGGALAAFLYMFAAMTGRDKFKETARRIAWDVVFTLALVLVLTSPLSQISSEVVRAIDPDGAHFYCGPRTVPDFCAVAVAKGYYQTLAIEAIGSIREMFRYYGIVKIFETLGVEQNDRNLGATSKPFEANVSFLMLMFEKLLDMMKLVVVVSAMQLFIFDFFSNPAVFVALLVFGSLLRMFPPTRKVGGLLLAIALAMFFFLPIMVAIPDALYFTYPINPNSNMRLNLFYSPGFMEFGVGLPPSIQPIAPSTLPQGFSPNAANRNIQQAFSNYKVLNYTGAGSAAPAPQNAGPTISMFRTFTAVLAPVLPGLAYAATYSVVEAAISTTWVGLIIPDSWISSASDYVAHFTGGAAALGTAYFIATSIQLIYTIIISASEVVATFLIFSGFFSYAILISTIGAIKSLSQFLGGDTEIAGLTKFI